MGHTCQGKRKDDEPCLARLKEPGYCHHHADQADAGGKIDEDLEALTGKQRKFVKEYLVDFNATRAAERAGYTGTYESARSQGYENLTKPHIWDPIVARMERHGMGYTESLARLAGIGRGSIVHFLRVDGSNVVFDLTTAEAQAKMHLVKKLKVDTTRQEDEDGAIVEQRVELELHDAKDALKTFLRVHGAFTDRVEHSVDEASASEIAALLGVQWKGTDGDDGH